MVCVCPICNSTVEYFIHRSSIISGKYTIRRIHGDFFGICRKTSHEIIFDKQGHIIYYKNNTTGAGFGIQLGLMYI